MAPEILNSVNYDTKADVWSLGILFYEMLFGYPPFTCTNLLAELIKNIEKGFFYIQKQIKISEEG